MNVKSIILYTILGAAAMKGLAKACSRSASTTTRSSSGAIEKALPRVVAPAIRSSQQKQDRQESNGMRYRTR